MKKILALWTTPRSMSSAFFHMMRERGDFMTYFEPFQIPFFLYRYGSREKIMQRRKFSYLPAHLEGDYNIVLEELRVSQGQEPVFIKDFGLHIVHKADEAFLSQFEHTFLIRHPAKMLPSLFNKLPEFTVEETGYLELLTLFERVLAISEKPPVVIAADDLLQNPHAMIKSYCEAVDIPFVSEALSWEADADAQFLQWDKQSDWFDSLKMSQGFQKQKHTDYVNVEENEYLQHTYDACLPSYTEMYAYRLPIHIDQNRETNAN